MELDVLQRQISSSPGARGKLVHDFSPSILNTIREELDTMSQLNFSDVAHQLMYKGDAVFSHEDIAAFQRAWASGGNPAHDFWRLVGQRRPNLSVNEVRDISKKHQMNDIIAFLENESNVTKIFQEKNLMLNRQLISKIGSNDEYWKIFAQELQFSRQDINNIAATVRRNYQFSPTESMMDTLMMKCPRMTCSNFMQQLQDMNMTDLSLKIGRWLMEDENNDQADLGGIGQDEDDDSDGIN